MIKKLVSCLVIAVFVSWAYANDYNAAMLYSKGTVWVNGRPLPSFTAAILLGDSIETKADSAATVNSPESSITLQPASAVKYQGTSVVLQAGTVSVVTSHRTAVQVGELSATPATTDETEFEVSNSNREVHIIARRNDLNVTCQNESDHLKEGQEMSRDQDGHCKKLARKGAFPPGDSGILRNPWLWDGAALGGGIACAILCFGGSSSPMSQSTTE